MVYKFNYAEAALEFVKNQGRVYLEAPSPAAALNAARALFGKVREECVKSLGSGQYLVQFKVALGDCFGALKNSPDRFVNGKCQP